MALKVQKYVFKGKNWLHGEKKNFQNLVPFKLFCIAINIPEQKCICLLCLWRIQFLLTIVYFHLSSLWILVILLFLLFFLFPFVCFVSHNAPGTYCFITAKGKQGRHKVQNINFVMVFNLEIFYTIEQFQFTAHLFEHSKWRTVFSSFYLKVVKGFLYYNNLKWLMNMLLACIWNVVQSNSGFKFRLQ